jgi:acetyl-CoA carboxylase biotin carboxylase subunit
MGVEMSKVLVANRGAIARRIIRACADMGLSSVAVYSDADAHAPYLSEATEAHLLPGVTPGDTYLNRQALLAVARASGADAVHPGYGFLSENAEFAQAIIDQGLTFVGPRPQWLARMGDKVAARELLAEHGFPVFGGSPLITGLDDAQEHAARLGYPLVVKPSGGGGGMGMEVVNEAADLEHAIKRAQTIAAGAFADSSVYLERWITQPRHIEFQILGDGRGGAMHMYERECSVQRRNQKLIEESPAPGLDAAKVLANAQLAAQACGEIGYDNVGTLETLFTADGDVGFLEMNTRIQVEHGVTEAITGCDLVRLQLELATGGELPATPARNGFAMEVRLYAEDSHTLLPSTGRLTTFEAPRLHGVRIETGYQQGQFVTPHYDALLAKLIAVGDTREMAIGRLLVGLRAFEVRGVQTNALLLTKVLQDEAFLTGNVNTEIVDRIMGGE